MYFEGRLLYGQSENDIRFFDSVLGLTRTGHFDIRRLLAQLRMEGEIALSDGSDGDEGPRLIPYADAHWIENRAAAFTTVSATGFSPVPGQKVSISRLELGSKVKVPIAVRHGLMTLTGGLGLVWLNTEGDHVNSVSRSHGRSEIGFSYGLDDNVQVDLESFYDGIGTFGYEGYGLSLLHHHRLTASLAVCRRNSWMRGMGKASGGQVSGGSASGGTSSEGRARSGRVPRMLRWSLTAGYSDRHAKKKTITGNVCIEYSIDFLQKGGKQTDQGHCEDVGHEYCGRGS